MLKPQDIVVLLKLVSADQEVWSYRNLAEQLDMSTSVIHASLKRCMDCKLARDNGECIVPHYPNLLEFLTHGISYAFSPKKGGLTRGMPTAHAAPPIAKHFAKTNEPPPVWPDFKGTVRGLSLEPLYRGVPFAAKQDPELYELLALVDAIRIGRIREKQLAIRSLTKRLSDS